jgi:putative Mg2+ transporter-C (MgtC) family protein
LDTSVYHRRFASEKQDQTLHLELTNAASQFIHAVLNGFWSVLVEVAMNAMDVLDIAPLNWWAILSCFLSAMIIGVERQLLGKPIGIRTSALICMGTYVFVAITRHMSNEMTDPSRIVGQVITGIGFLGAGVMMSKNGSIVGLTSAAAIWILAAVGVIVGMGYYLLGVKIAVLTAGILVGVSWLESSFAFMQRGVHVKLEKRKRRRKKASSDD